MKTKHSLTLCFCVAVAAAACKDKEIDSQEITILSPKSHEVVKDKDSVRVDALIKPTNASVASYSINVMNKHDKLLFNSQEGCDCKSVSEVKIKKSFMYNVDKTLNVYLEIKAVLDDGRKIREKIPFVIAE